MDFHGLTRRELQGLCKKNQIPANQTNAAMADALHALSNILVVILVKTSLSFRWSQSLGDDNDGMDRYAMVRKRTYVEGIEEFSQSEGFQTPAPCTMSQRKAWMKSELPPDAVVIALEDSAAPVSRATRHGTAARASASRRRVTSEEEGETTEVVALEVLQSPLPTRTAATRRATAGKSTRRASEAQHDVVKPVGTESNLKMSVRRSARLKSVDRSVELLPSAANISRRKKMAIKIGALNEEPEESTENMAELLVDTVETADFTNVEEGALESEGKAGLFPASNDLTVEATEEMTLSEENKSEVVDEKVLIGDFKSEPFLPAEVMSPTKESKLDVVDATNPALLEKETEFVDMSAGRSARIKSVNKAVDECLSVTKSRSKKMDVKIGALTAEQEDFTDNIHTAEMVNTVHTANYTNVEVLPFVSVDKAGFYSGSKDIQNAGDEDESNAAVEAAEEVALSEESMSEVAEEEETVDFKRESLPESEVMPPSEEIKNDVDDNTNIAILEEETKTVNQESFLGDMDEEGSHTQLPLEDGEEIKSDVVGNTTIALLEVETESLKQESFHADMDEEDSHTQLPNALSNVLEDGEKTGNKDFMGSIGNFFIDESAVSEKTEMELTGQEELNSLNPTLTDMNIEEYEQIAGLATDVSMKDKNLFVGDVPVEAVGEELAVNINSIEWSFFMGGCGDSAILSPDATPSVLTAKEHDVLASNRVSEFHLASNRVSESPFLLNILFEEEQSEKGSETVLIEGTEETPKKENLNTNSVSKTPILFDTAETMLDVGTEKKMPGKESVKKNLSANSVSTTSNLFDRVAEEMLLVVGTEKKTPKIGATPGKSNGKKKTQEDADKENNGGQSLKRESVKKPLHLVKEKSSMYQDLSLRQLKVLYKEKASGVKKAPALQPLNQNCVLGDGNI